MNRITKFLTQNPPDEFRASTLNIRKPEAHNYAVFSQFIILTLIPYDRYECHVGLGYSRIVSDQYDIQVCNPGWVSRGVKSIVVDGSILEGTLVPTFGNGGVHSVEVKLG